MSSSETYPGNPMELDRYMTELQQQFPERCTSSSGGMCGQVEVEVLNIVGAVKRKEITSDEGVTRASEVGGTYDQQCNYGFSMERECGKYVICSIAGGGQPIK